MVIHSFVDIVVLHSFVVIVVLHSFVDDPTSIDVVGDFTLSCDVVFIAGDIQIRIPMMKYDAMRLYHDMSCL